MKNFKSVSLIAAVLVLSACGSQSDQSSLNTYNANNNGTTITTPTGSNPYNLPTASEQRLELTGTAGGTATRVLTFNSSSTLRVKVTALSAPNITVPGYTNWVFPYGCMSVTVTVNGMTKTTQILKVNGLATSPICQNAPTSETLDFTGMISGSGTVQITYSNAQYDNCRYNWPMNYGCSMSQIWSNHRVAFNTQVQTDGTYMQ